LSDTAQLVKTNSYGFFGYVVPGVVVTLYLATVVSYLRYQAPLHILAQFHQVNQGTSGSPAASPYEYISFLLVFVVAAYIVGHLSEACAQMIYDRFYMRRIYGHRLRQLILDEGTDRKETHKNFYRAAISSLYISAFLYLLAVAINGHGFVHGFIRNAGIAFLLVFILAGAIGTFWRWEKTSRKEEEKAQDYLKDCEAALNTVKDILRGEKFSDDDEVRVARVRTLWERVSGDKDWQRWINGKPDVLEEHLAEAMKYLNKSDWFVGDELVEAVEALDKACKRMRVLKSRNTVIVKRFSDLSKIAELITSKFIDDERPIGRQVKSRFHEGFEKALRIDCHPSLGSEVNRLPMWYIVETQKDLSSFIVKYRSQAAMMCNISGAFLLCTLLSIFAFQGDPYDRDFAVIGIATMLISMFTSLRYFYVHDNDYVKTLIYAFVIGTTKPEPAASATETAA
jgi:hypothetical protein